MAVIHYLMLPVFQRFGKMSQLKFHQAQWSYYFTTFLLIFHHPSILLNIHILSSIMKLHFELISLSDWSHQAWPIPRFLCLSSTNKEIGTRDLHRPRADFNEINLYVLHKETTTCWREHCTVTYRGRGWFWWTL